MTSAITTQAVQATSGPPANLPTVNQIVTVSTQSATITREPHRVETREWLLASESALAKGWDNPQDAQYDAL